jgi:hypothetical protein
VEVSDKRLEATYLEVLKPYLDFTQDLISKNKYNESLVFQLDETSCQVKYKKNYQKTCSYAKKYALPTISAPDLSHNYAIHHQC